MRGFPRDFWGKLEQAPDGSVTGWHPLADHCADVAACCEALLRETLLARRLAALAGRERLSAVQDGYAETARLLDALQAETLSAWGEGLPAANRHGSLGGKENRDPPGAPEATSTELVPCYPGARRCCHGR